MEAYCNSPLCNIIIKVNTRIFYFLILKKTRLFSTVGCIHRNLKNCIKPIKSAAYTAMVRPTVEYTCMVWDPSSQKKIKAIEQVQKRAARFVHNNYTDQTVFIIFVTQHGVGSVWQTLPTPCCVTNMIKSLKWENLEDRRKSVRLCMISNT
jgi:hypothetical protein